MKRNDRIKVGIAKLGDRYLDALCLVTVDQIALIHFQFSYFEYSAESTNLCFQYQFQFKRPELYFRAH